MADKDQHSPDKARRQRAAQPRSPGAEVAGEHQDLPGEGELPRREDMTPGDHRPREEPADRGRD